MNLNESQKQTIAQWVDSGTMLAEIQTKIAEEFGISMTYMDVRFLVDDLNLELKDAVPAKTASPEAVPESTAGTSAIDTSAAAGVTHHGVPVPPPAHPGQTPRGSNPQPFADEDEVPAGTPAADAAAQELSQVALTVDPVQVPGVLVGGSVRFPDGVRGKWLIDQSGQLGLDELPPGYRPTQEAVVQFNLALKNELRKLGYQ